MNYTDDEIERYINILKSLVININENSPIKSNRVTCNHCQKSDSTIESGYYYCTNCGFGLGHVIGYNDKSDYDRINFYQKSIYQRKYHFQNNIEEANKKFTLNLSADDKYELYKNLMNINKEGIKKLIKHLKERY